MSATDKHHFQAEVQQLLDIVIHSLYTDREVFIRELISNAADACEKLRFLQAAGRAVQDPEKSLGIAIIISEKDHTFTISDTGVGMTQADLIEHLGTIARSGTKAFLQQLGENQRADARFIGRFGVGFYSAFMVAAKITVVTRSYLPDEQGWQWTSEGPGGYELAPASEAPRGTHITLQLKEDAKEFAQAVRVEPMIKRFSNFVQFPIELDGKRLNTVQAIWARNKSEIKEEDYNEFYQYVGHDFTPPLLRLHFSADAPLAIQALLFVPSHNLESLGLGRAEPAVSLYCRKVLVQTHVKGLFPDWLRFLKGVVDSEDFPLNISRETLQDTALMQKLNRVLASRFLKLLEETADKDAGAYDRFYQMYSRFLKEGAAHDFTHREALAKLLRYESSAGEKGKTTALPEYVKRMPADQKEIYYVFAPERAAAESNPFFEAFRTRNLEVLFAYDPWDEFVLDALHEFDGKPLRNIERANLELGDASRKEGALPEAQAQALVQWFKDTLKDRVGEVRISKRLVDSPALAADRDKFMTSSLRRYLRSVSRPEEAPKTAPPDLEINPAHPVMIQLATLRDQAPELAGVVAQQVLDNACLAAGLLEDSRPMLQRLNTLLEHVLKHTPPKPAG